MSHWKVKYYMYQCWKKISQINYIIDIQQSINKENKFLKITLTEH